MSVSDIQLVMARIKVAEPDSPISVFRTEDNLLEAVFANTVSAVSRIKYKADMYIGTYCKPSMIRVGGVKFKSPAVMTIKKSIQSAIDGVSK